MAALQPQTLTPGKCEQCRKPLDADHQFALWSDHANLKRSCEHLVCGTCRGIMGGWRDKRCPNSKCAKRFYYVQDALSPSTSSVQDFFKFVNCSQSGRITKDEMIAWYSTNFSMTRDDAVKVIDDNWHMWDIPKSRSFLKLGFMRSYDQGDLDIDEFATVQDFMAESFARSHAPPVMPVAAAANTMQGAEPRGQKRTHAEANSFAEGVLRNVAQKKLSQSEDLQRQLNANQGREWFDHFDVDKSGNLEKGELTNALYQTFAGTHKVALEQIKSIVDAIWDAIDEDGSGSVQFLEFQMLREAVIAQLNTETVTRAVSSLVSA